MLTLQLVACIGMISGGFLAFDIHLEDFITHIFGGILGKPQIFRMLLWKRQKQKKLLT